MVAAWLFEATQVRHCEKDGEVLTDYIKVWPRLAIASLSTRRDMLGGQECERE